METQIFLIATTVFLLANLVVGLWASRGIRTMDDYALANRKVGGGALLATLVATLFNNRDTEFSVLCNRGLLNLLNPFSFAFMGILLGLFVFPKLTSFTKEQTISDVMHTMYGGRFVRLYTLVVMSILSLGVILGQMVSLGGVSNMLELEPLIVIFCIGGLVTLYTCFGGVRSVVKTDILQSGYNRLGYCCIFHCYHSSERDHCCDNSGKPKPPRKRYSF